MGDRSVLFALQCTLLDIKRSSDVDNGWSTFKKSA